MVGVGEVAICAHRRVATILNDYVLPIAGLLLTGLLVILHFHLFQSRVPLPALFYCSSAYTPHQI
jgi:hypothetical protein